MDTELYIGLMSGTSLDGVDAVLVAISDNLIKMQAHHFIPMPIELKNRLNELCVQQSPQLLEIGLLDYELGHLYADAVLALLQKAQVDASQIKAIGNHGQTVFHHPQKNAPFTMQLGDANIIAVRTGITTIADFRRKDMALGGQGAPLVPAFHQELISDKKAFNVVLNIGGIANISVIYPNVHKVLGYDTGPGNTLLDMWCSYQTPAAYDKDACLAQKGCVYQPLLAEMLQDPYFTQSIPKSTGREYFNLNWLKTYCTKAAANKVKIEDIQATLCALTTQSIGQELNKLAQNYPQSKHLFVCGGGVHNPVIMRQLIQLLPQWSVTTTHALNIDPDYMEAIAFAWLAYRRINNLPSNLPSVTGASHHTSLGVIYLAD